MKTNLKVFSQADIVERYETASLQNVEVVILLRYFQRISNMRILDIGCGAGRTAFFLRQLTPDYLGIDYSERMIAACRKKYPEQNFAVCSYTDMASIPDGSYDVVFFAFNGIDYVEHVDRLRGIGEINRVLRENGLFVFSTHNRNFRNARTRPRLVLYLNPVRFIRYFWGYLSAWRNHLRNRRLEQSQEEYAVINDQAHQWSLLTYYIDRFKQSQQLAGLGFKTIGVFDENGNLYDQQADDSGACYLYYVAEKCGELRA